jgi:hypothetical protein
MSQARRINSITQEAGAAFAKLEFTLNTRTEIFNLLAEFF